MRFFRKKTPLTEGFLHRSFIEIEPGLQLAYTDQGQGDAIVFVPGFTFPIDVFAKQLAPFSEGGRFIAIDPRSHGASSATDAGNNYPQHGQDLAVILDKLKLQNIVLVGWSFGALSAWSYLEQFGLDRIRAFVCIDMPPVPMSADEDKGTWVEGTVENLSAGYHALLTPEGQRQFMDGYAQEVMIQRELSRAELDWITGLSLKTPTAAVKDLFASGLFSNYAQIAKKIDQHTPQLYVIAEHWADTAVPYVKERLPNAQLEILGGHMMFWEHPDRFNQALQHFIRSIG